MRDSSCVTTDRLLAAARQGPFEPELARHAADCGACASALAVDAPLRALGAELGHGRGRASFARLERRAELLRRERAAQRATRWLERWRQIGLAVAAAAVTLALAGAGSGWLDWLVAPLLRLPQRALGFEAASVAFAVLGGSALALWLLQEWAED